MQTFIFPVILTPEKDSGGFVVKFVDFPEAITQGENIEDALEKAVDCLEEAVANRMVMNLDIPNPTSTKNYDYTVVLPTQMAAKAALYIAIKEMGISKMELAKKINCDEKEIRRLLDPRHASKIPRIEAVLAKLGNQLILSYNRK